jgi:opacity protein-like surface antigen
LEAISKTITYGHPVNGLTRSRIWRWAMGGEEPISNDGPYERYSVAYRNVYETVKLKNDTVPVKKSFSGVELQAKYHPKAFGSKLYIYSLSKFNSIQKEWSPLPVLTEKAYVRQYSSELEVYYAINSKVVLSSYLGHERTLANFDTETDEITKRPRNQTGEGYGFGIDYTVAKNTALFLRHRWFSFEDTSFERDQFNGTETILELKLTF